MPPTQNPQLPNNYSGQPAQSDPGGMPPQQPAQPMAQPQSLPQALPLAQPQPGYTGYQQGAQQQPLQPLQPLAQQPAYQPYPAGAQPALQPMRVIQPAAKEDASPYDFFLEPGKAPKRKTGGMSGFTKILLGAGALMLILGILAVVLSASKGNKGTASPTLLTVAASQQEIIRVSTLGQEHVESASLKNFTATAISTVNTAQQAIIGYGNKNGVKIDTKQLELTKNSQNDKVLDAALSASTYDPTFRSTMQQLLASYEAKAQKARDSSTTQSARALLEADISNATLLGQMLNQQ